MSQTKFARFSSRQEDLLPRNFYNLKADLPTLPKPPLHPGTKQPISPQDLEPVFPKGFIAQEATLAGPAAARRPRFGGQWPTANR